MVQLVTQVALATDANKRLATKADNVVKGVMATDVWFYGMILATVSSIIILHRTRTLKPADFCLDANKRRMGGARYNAQEGTAEKGEKEDGMSMDGPFLPQM